MAKGKVLTSTGKWNETKNTRMIAARVPLGDHRAVNEVVENAGISVSDFIKNAVRNELQRMREMSGEVNVATVG